MSSALLKRAPPSGDLRSPTTEDEPSGCESAKTGLTEALDRTAARLETGAPDEGLAAELESLAASLDGDSGGAVANKRRAALGETLSGIAARLR